MNSVFRDIQNYQGLGKCYQPQPSASTDNTYLALDNSRYHEKPHPIPGGSHYPTPAYKEVRGRDPFGQHQDRWPGFVRWERDWFFFISITNTSLTARVAFRHLVFSAFGGGLRTVL